MKKQIEKSKKGFPCLWEAGGGYTNTGEATIIADKEGKAKNALYIKRRGHLANSKHALVPLVRGDYIIEADHHRGDFIIEIYRVVDFKDEEYDEEKIHYAITEIVNFFSEGEWDKEPPTFLKSALETAMQKATCYHCREPHFIANIE